ncbi:M20 aminoacylase family protein [Pseudochelatococcus contaminans]|uniref:Hippurate hydrolase n=1 Tax=Pseudochelatococcus contaminans TaxID=1538103 RepID=A0A7W5Z1K0_9HYPH|nr:M20 aminoacylase family protein [Pseudochelatococcus contaminans]MBB3808332.1 hippurate hydrolase [Pseudochelatococcus contaminans]
MSGASARPAAGNNDQVERRILDTIDEFIELRRDLHAHPELAFEEERTSGIVAGLLESWGYKVTTGIGGTGVVGTLKRGEGERKLAIRADMDALPIKEATGLPYASRKPGIMHACGHDGHTAVLLAAARYLALNGHFSGTLNLIFQPAEEVGKGAQTMVQDGVFKRFPTDAIFGLHNWPGVAEGQFGFVEGPAMASIDYADITVQGSGGHGASPHLTVDPIVASASIIMALQSVVARNVDPLGTAVVTVGAIHGGQAANVIPESVELALTIRSYDEEIRAQVRERIIALAQTQAASFGATAEVDYRDGYPAVVNHAAETAFARAVAVDSFGAARVEKDFAPRTASEDFANFLLEKPGSYLFVGNGNSAPLHSAKYNFNDAIIAPAAIYWARLAQAYLS